MQVKIQKWGSNLAVRIPKSFAMETKLEPDSPVDVSIQEGRLIITPLPASLTLDELLSQITEDNLHRENESQAFYYGFAGQDAVLDLDDPRWKGYKGGYRMIYDASAPLRRLWSKGPSPEIWDELWEELHHQGDVDEASYAAVPHLVEWIRRSDELEWKPLSLIAVIELERLHNPPPPSELAPAYFEAIERLPQAITNRPQRQWNELVARAAVACIALARGQREMARVYLEMSGEEAQEWLKRS